MKIINGNSLEVLKRATPNSIDAVVTDPPYGLSFMGKKWDYDVPSTELWVEAMRVLKPGGHLLSFAGSRTYHRMAVNIEDAGFEIRDQIMWVYGSGFPKSHNIKKTLEKKYLCQFIENVKNVEKELKLIQVESSEEKIGSVVVYVGMSQGEGQESLTVTGKVEDSQGQTVMYQFVSTEKIDSNILLSLKKKLEENYNKENKHITLTELKTIIDLKIYNLLQYQNTLKSIVTTNHTALKPSHEPIVVARKPLSEKTIAKNVLEWGTGGINIDGCRVGADNDYIESKGNSKTMDSSNDIIKIPNKLVRAEPNIQGRFPANFIHDGSDEATSGLGDKARYFYCSKASKKDRNEGLEGFEEKEATQRMNASEFRYEEGREPTPRANQSVNKNNHPTVKPTKLMQYLVRLVTPKGGTVLDPFMGSGSTGKACKLEGFDFIGIELDPEYCKIAEARIENAKKN